MSYLAGYIPNEGPDKVCSKELEELQGKDPCFIHPISYKFSLSIFYLSLLELGQCTKWTLHLILCLEGGPIPTF